MEILKINLNPTGRQLREVPCFRDMPGAKEAHVGPQYFPTCYVLGASSCLMNKQGKTYLATAPEYLRAGRGSASQVKPYGILYGNFTKLLHQVKFEAPDPKKEEVKFEAKCTLIT